MADPAGVVRLPPDVEAVVARWNPEGMDRLRRTRAARSPSTAVAVVGPERSGKTSLIDELSAHDPDLTFTSSPVEAAVVLMLLDAAAPIGSEALGVVHEVAVSGNRALFALNKIDAHSDWRSVRDRDLRVLAEYATCFADVSIWPVSTRLARIARTQSGCTDIVRSSGIVELHAALTAILARDPLRSRAEYLGRATEGAAAQALDRIHTKAESLRTSKECAALRADRAQLVVRRDGGRAEAMTALRSQVQLARVELLHDVASRVRTVNVGTRSEIDRARKTELPTFPDRLVRQVAQLTAEVDERTRTRLAELGTKVSGQDGLLVAAALPTGTAAEVGEGPEPRHRGVEDRMMVVVGASAGVGIGRLAVAPLSMVPALDIASIPVTLVLGGFAAWWLARSRSHVADRAHLRQWAGEALVNVKSQLEQRVLGAIVGTEAELSERLVRLTSARMVHVDQEIARHDADLRQLAARTSGQLASCERDRDTIARGVAELREEFLGHDGTERSDDASNKSR